MLTAYLKKLPVIGRLHVAVRARLQERRAARTLSQAVAKLAAEGRHIRSVAEIATELRSRRSARRPGVGTKSKGDLHVFLPYYISNWERILPMSLAPFGRVTSFEWRSEGFDDRLGDWPRRREAMNKAMKAAFDRANRESPVDAVVGYFSGRTVLTETIEHMKRGGAIVFNFCWDDKLWMPGPIIGGIDASPAAVCSAVDLNLTNAPDSIAKYEAFGGMALFWPEAAHPEVHKPVATEFKYDVSFVGQRYGWRPSFVSGLSRRGIRVACFGRGWENGPLTDEEMVRLYSESRVNLGFSGVGYSRRLMCLKGRDFEVPMAGGLYLTQDNPELRHVYLVGTEIDVYQSVDDCADKIRRFLGDPECAARMRAAGRRRAIGGHTYECRYQQIFRLAGLLDAE